MIGFVPQYQQWIDAAARHRPVSSDAV